MRFDPGHWKARRSAVPDRLYLRTGGQLRRPETVHQWGGQVQVPGRQNLPGQLRQGLGGQNSNRFRRFVRMPFHLFRRAFLP